MWLPNAVLGNVQVTVIRDSCVYIQKIVEDVEPFHAQPGPLAPVSQAVSGKRPGRFRAQPQEEIHRRLLLSCKTKVTVTTKAGLGLHKERDSLVMLVAVDGGPKQRPRLRYRSAS